MPQFTATVEAQYASELREKRDRTDADIAAEYRFTSVTRAELPKTVRKDRAKATLTRNSWIRDAAVSALGLAFMDAQDEKVALDEATFAITVADLRVTATLTIPDAE